MSQLEQAIATPMTKGEMRQRLQLWYDRQIEIISKAHGKSWPEHKEWVDDYLKEEVRQRLWDLGWRPKK